MKKFYFTSAIPYVNAAPHIGHAQEFIYSDTIRRYKKLQGINAKYLCGSDENGLKIVRAAVDAECEPKKFTDINQQKFLDLAKKLQVEFDYWQRGTNPNHYKSSQELWKLCSKNGDIYKKNYSGLYCVGCEAYYTKDELDRNGECFEHPGRKLEKIAEENYFFRLSKYQKFLQDLIESDQLKIIPDFRRNEALSFIKKGLDDFSISRSKIRTNNWGVEVPEDPEQTIYVWFDALNIYQSGIGFGWNSKLYNSLWPADLHIIGKGILRFHAAYWIAILKSAGLKLPKSIFVHGYLTVNGAKMSKTLGNVIDPVEIINKYGSDPLRYYLLREIPAYQDGDFSERRFIELYNADLANGLGNTVARIAKLLEINKVNYIKAAVNKISDDIKIWLDDYKFDLALKSIWDKISDIDKRLQIKKPWEQNSKHGQELWNEFIENVRQIAYDLQPFIPATADKILTQFRGPIIKSVAPLFPRIK